MRIEDSRIRTILAVYPVGAIRILRDFYQKDLFRMVRRLTHDDNEANRIVNDMFVLLHSNCLKIDTYRPLPVTHYMVRVVRNKVIARYCWRGYDADQARQTVMQIGLR